MKRTLVTLGTLTTTAAAWTGPARDSSLPPPPTGVFRPPNSYHHTPSSSSSTTARFISSEFHHPEEAAASHTANFYRGTPILIEIRSFGPLGASVDVVGLGHDPKSIIPEEAPPLGKGLVLQQEIKYFRESRNDVDVVVGEVLPAYVEKVREEDGKLHIALRVPGGKAKANQVGKLILERLKSNGRLQVGDKSSPAEIAQVFPGVSKGAFKKAVAALYKKGIVQPGPTSISYLKKPYDS